MLSVEGEAEAGRSQSALSPFSELQSHSQNQEKEPSRMHSRFRLVNRDESPLTWLDRDARTIFWAVVLIQST
jgi:hypothetical protein